jgi:hypothetical protein
VLSKKKERMCLSAEWTDEFYFRVVCSDTILECGVVMRRTGAVGLFWEVRLLKILSNMEGVTTGQMMYSLALPGKDAVRLIREGARKLGFKGKVHVYAMDGLLLLS